MFAPCVVRGRQRHRGTRGRILPRVPLGLCHKPEKQLGQERKTPAPLDFQEGQAQDFTPDAPARRRTGYERRISPRESPVTDPARRRTASVCPPPRCHWRKGPLHVLSSLWLRLHGRQQNMRDSDWEGQHEKAFWECYAFGIYPEGRRSADGRLARKRRRETKPELRS